MRLTGETNAVRAVAARSEAKAGEHSPPGYFSTHRIITTLHYQADLLPLPL